MDQKPEQPPPRKRLGCAGVLYWLFAIVVEAVYIGFIVRHQAEPGVVIMIVGAVVWPFAALWIYGCLARGDFNDIEPGFFN